MTTLARYEGVAFGLSGSNVVLSPNASVRVMREDTGALVSLFSDRGGLSGIANPMTADAYGRFGFYCAATTDGLKIRVTEAASPGLEYTLRHQQCGTMGEVDYTDLTKALAALSDADTYLQALLADLVSDGDTETYPAASDYLLLGDVSTGLVKAMLVQNVFRALSSMSQITVSPSTGRVPVLDAGSPDQVGYLLLQDLAVPSSYLAGLTLSNSVASPTETHSIDVAAGMCRDSTNAANIIISSAITDGVLQSAGSWSAGNFGRKLDTGARANSTWYHVFAIRKDSDGSGDWLFSTSATAPTMPAGYTYFRRIGSVRTDSSGNLLSFSQNGDEFLLVAGILDVDATNPGTSAVIRTLSGVPTGIKVGAIVNWRISNSGGSGGAGVLISALDQSDQAASQTAAPLMNIGEPISAVGGSYNFAGQLVTRTNTSAQVRSRLIYSDGSVILRGATVGWVDTRGRNT